MELIREISAIAAVLLLLAGSLWRLRRKGMVRLGVARLGAPGNRPRSLQVVERAVLSPQHSLHLVRLGGRAILVGVAPSGCTVLESLGWDQLEAGPRAGAAGAC